MAQHAGISSGSVKGINVYCIVKSRKQPSILRVPAGLPDATAPELVDVGGGIRLVLCEVPLETYGSGSLDARLQDLDWVGSVALAHEAVVEHFARQSGLAVIPMKLFTMFSSRERAVKEISGRRTAIDAAARRIAGAEEWGIRILRSAPDAASRLPGRTTRSGSVSGAAFLAAKKQARDDTRAARVAAAESALDAFERLAALSREAHRRNDTPVSASTPPLLDAAFLVPAERRARFKAAAKREAARCAKAGAELTLSGPWPAYNFVETGSRAR